MMDVALARASAYLAAAGLPPTRDNTRRLLLLLQDALDQADPLGWVIAELPRRFGLRPPEVPVAAPPLRRGSIGYGNDGKAAR
jgi:hypothetical protein